MTDFDPIEAVEQLKEYCIKQPVCHLCLLNDTNVCDKSPFPYQWKVYNVMEDEDEFE